MSVSVEDRSDADALPVEATNPRDDSQSPPPFGGTWGRVYVGLLTLLAIYIALFYAVTVHFE